MLPETQIIRFLESGRPADAAHDLSHIRRVVKTALELCDKENADPDVVYLAAWLHDCVTLPKNSPDRHLASGLAAKEADGFLGENGISSEIREAVAHCIETHSFSAGRKPLTTEAKVLQDADRIDALGAIGIARCFITGAGFKAALYNPDEPRPVHRKPDEKSYIIDHFYEKLLTLHQTMNTDAGREEARKRSAFMETFLEKLYAEIG